MKRELSSKQTFFLKIILPIIFAAMLMTVFAGIIFSSKKVELLPLIILFPLIGLFGIFSMYLTVMRYKKVSVDYEFLYVSNYRKEIKIPVSNIADVTEIKWVRTRPITIHFKNDSEFGRKIVFMPKFNGFRMFADNPIIAELKESAKILESNQMNDKNKQYVFQFECRENWEDLDETAGENIRHCGQCDRNVYLAQNAEGFAENAKKGNCVYAVPMRTAGIPLMVEFENE